MTRNRQQRAGATAPEPRILYRSETLVAVDKPQGVIVHGDGTGAPTLTDTVRALVAGDSSFSTSAAAELQALQRLDRDTSGIVLFSLAKATQPAYDRMIAEHALAKRYLAIVAGNASWEQRVFKQPIGRDRHDARRMRVSRTGKPALTRARVLARARWHGRPVTLLAVEIETGRKHQIRVHLSHAGLPLLGDELYGCAPGRAGGMRSGYAGARDVQVGCARPLNGNRINRQQANPSPTLMLHATELSFTDPVSGARVRIVSPAPARMRALFPRLDT